LKNYFLLFRYKLRAQTLTEYPTLFGVGFFTPFYDDKTYAKLAMLQAPNYTTAWQKNGRKTISPLL